MKKVVRFLCVFAALTVLVAAAAMLVSADAPATCPQCEKAVTWTGLSTIAEDATSIPAGHYVYDYTEDTHTWTAEKAVSGAVCICIPEGKTLASEARVFGVRSGGTLAICGQGTIQGGHFDNGEPTTERYGGAVMVSSGGKLILREATLTDAPNDTNLHNSSNGGVLNIYGTFEMYSGTVKDGKASNCGGNIFVAPAGVCKLYGGTVSGGTCSVGKSICVQGKILLAGDANVNHVYLWNKSVSFEEMLTVQGKYTGTATLQYRSATFTEGMDLGVSDSANLSKANITLSSSGWYLAVNGTDLIATATEPEAGDKKACKHCGQTVTFTPLTEADAAATELAAGHYYLDQEETVAWAQKTISGDVVIDLNGQTLQGAGRLFQVPKGNTLSVQGQGNVNGGGFPTGLTTGDRAGGVFGGTGTFNIYDGTYTAAPYGDNTVTPYNGGIISTTSGTVNIYGGTLNCPSVGGVGGSLFIGPSAKLNVYGGKITGENPAVCVQGKVTLTGDAQVDCVQLRLKSGGPAFGQQLTIKDTFSGVVSVQFYDASADANLVDGGVIGISDNADIRHASISVQDSDEAAVGLYLLAENGQLKLSEEGPAPVTKEAECKLCGKTVTWTALTEGFAGQETLTTGHYYLDFAGTDGTWAQKTVYGNVCLDLNGKTLHGSTRAFVVESGCVMNIFGEGTVVGRGRSSSLKVETRAGGTILVEADGTLNLYEGTLTHETVSGFRAGNGGVLNVIGTFNMYGGQVKGGYAGNAGGNIFVTGTGALNLLGGSVSGGTCSTAKDIACRGSVTLAGDASADEIYLWPTTGGPVITEMLTVRGAYTGKVKLRLAAANLVAGQDVGTSQQADLSGATITTNNSTLGLVTMGSDLVLLGAKPVAIFNGGQVVGAYSSLTDAIAAYTDMSQRIILFGDVQTLEVNKDICLDLNGYDVAAVTGTGTVYCMDSQTDDYTVEDGIYGTIPADTQVVGVDQGSDCAKDGYVMLPGENGTVTFHRLTLQVQSMSLRPSREGLYMTCIFAGDDMLKEQVKGFGVALELDGDPADTQGLTRFAVYEKDSFGIDAVGHSLLVYGILKDTLTAEQNDARSQMQIYGRAYVETQDGKIYGDIRSRSLKEVVEGIYNGQTLKQVGVDGMLDGMTFDQRFALYGMYVEHKATLDGWNIPNLKAVAPADEAALEKAIADNEILQARRAKVTAKMRQMGDLYWRATEDITYHISSTARWVDFYAGRVYRGMPYAYARSDEQTFLEFASEPDEKGIYNISGLKEDHLGNGSALARIGNDCSGSVNFAWNQAGADISGTKSSRYMIEENGYLKVGDYEYTPTEDGRVGISKEIVAANGQERMFAAYAKVQPGDALDTTAAAGGHVILVMGKHVVYNPDGSINGDLSYIHTLEQTPGPVSRGVETHAWNEELGEVVYSIYKEVKSSFNSVFSSGYIPITCKVLIDASPVEEAKVTDSLTEDQYTYENLLRGQFTTNRMVSSVTLTVTDENGEVFKVTSSGIRSVIKSFNLQNFLTENYEGHMVLRGALELDKLVAGNEYHCTVLVSLGSGEQIMVRDFDFTATDADISKPDGAEEEPPAPGEDDEGEVEEPTDPNV